MLKVLSIVAAIYFSAFNLLAQTKLETVVQKGHNAAVKAVVISPNGKFLVTGSRDKSAKLWDKETGRELRSFLGHTLTVNGLDISRSGKLLATSSADNTAKVWDILTGKELFTTPADTKYMTDVAFSPDEKWLVATGYGDKTKVWNITTQQLVREIDVNADQGSGYGSNLAFSPDGKWLAIGEDNKTAKLYTFPSFQIKDTLKPKEGWCGGCGTLVAFSPDSKYLLKLSHNDRLEKYDVTTAKLVQAYGEAFDGLAGVAFSPDGKQVMAASDKKIFIWEAVSGSLVHEFTFETDLTEVIYTDTASTLLASGSNNTAFLISGHDGKITKTFTGVLNQADKGGVEYDPDSYWDSYIAKYLRLKNKVLINNAGNSLLKGRFGTKVKSWDIATGETLIEYTGLEKAAAAYAYSPDGKCLVTGDVAGKVTFWETATGKRIRQIDAHREPVFEVKFNPEGTEVAVTSWDATMSFWDVEKGTKNQRIDFTNNSAYALSYTPDGLYVVTGRLNKALELWEPDSKTVVRTFEGHTDVVVSISFGKDKQMLTASWDGTARIWDVSTGLMVKKFKGHTAAVQAAIYNADGKQVITAGDDRTIRIWDINTSKTVKVLTGHQAEVTSLCLSKDGKILISASLDGVIKLWNLDKGTEFYEHIHVGNNDWMAKTNEGYFIATQGARDAIHFVKGLESYGSDQFFEEFYRPDLLPNMYKSRGGLGKLVDLDTKLASSPPPLIKLSIQHIETAGEAEVFVKVFDNGGGVSELRLSHNGKQIVIDAASNPLPKGKGNSSVYKEKVSLVGGTNVFSVSGFSDGRVESAAVEAKVNSMVFDKDATCYVFAIGIDKYKNSKLTLNYARADAEAFVKTITAHTSKLFSKIEVISLYDEQASKANILHQMDELSKKVHTNDVFLFYYAGHGSMAENRFFLIPVACTRLYELNGLLADGIEASQLQEKMKHIKALKQVIIMDACQSGGSVELLAMRGAGEEKAIAQLSRSAGIHVLASAGSEQFAKELGTLGHGLFTYVLLSALEGKADGAPKDGKVTVYELKSYLDDQVPEVNQQYSGKPQYPYTFSKGHDFPLVIE